MKISDKANTLLNYFTKSKLSKLLEISRPTLYKNIDNDSWKGYQIERINRWYNKIEETKKIMNCSIKSIYFNNGKMAFVFDPKDFLK